MLLALRLASMSGVATVYATHLPSGEICGSATRCILIMSSKVMGCFASWAAIPNPYVSVSAPTTTVRRKMPFIVSLPVKLQCECLVELRIMSRFRYESNSAVARPEPVDERQSGGGSDHEEFSTVHARDKRGSHKEPECGNKDSSGEAKCVG